jgi:2,5-diamino-6-(ribosylamino)-4(3H)-pyrimidinone 5'-phosphate reductase
VANEKCDRARTTLFAVMSVDGKISSGEGMILDPDRDWKRIKGVSEGLHQYYELEHDIAANSLNSGLVMEKVGINERSWTPKKNPNLNFMVIDRRPHLNENGVRYLSLWASKLIVATDNKDHPACVSGFENVIVMLYPNGINLLDFLQRIKQEHGINDVVIQTGGTLNAQFVRQDLVDCVVLVVAPLLVGGKDTPTLIDGISARSEEELAWLKALKLTQCKVLNNSYLELRYEL